jgi:hypothetical protein
MRTRPALGGGLATDAANRWTALALLFSCGGARRELAASRLKGKDSK